MKPICEFRQSILHSTEFLRLCNLARQNWSVFLRPLSQRCGRNKQTNKNTGLWSATHMIQDGCHSIFHAKGKGVLFLRPPLAGAARNLSCRVIPLRHSASRNTSWLDCLGHGASRATTSSVFPSASWNVSESVAKEGKKHTESWPIKQCNTAVKVGWPFSRCRCACK